MTDEANLAARLRHLEGVVDNLSRHQSSPPPNLRDLRDTDLSKIKPGEVPVYNKLTGRWEPGAKGLTGRDVLSETAAGVDRAEVGVVGGTPRLILENPASVIWEIDNDAGTLRFFTPGSLKASLNAAGLFAVADLAVTAVPPVPQPNGAASAGTVLGPPARPDHVHAGSALAPMVGKVRATKVMFVGNLLDTLVPFHQLMWLDGLIWTPPYTFTIPTGGDGDYEFFAEAIMDVAFPPGTFPPANGFGTIHVVKNEGTGTEQVLSDPHFWLHGDTGSPHFSLHASGEVPLIAGDTIKVNCFHSIGGSPGSLQVTIPGSPGPGAGSPYDPPFLSLRRTRARPVGQTAEFILPVGHSVIRTDYTGDVGCEFKIKDRALSVTHLGRYVINDALKTLRIVRKSDNVEMVSVGSVLGTNGQFAWSAITPITLAANTSYYLSSQETSGAAAQWFGEYGPTYRSEHVELIGGAFRPNGGGAFSAGTAGCTFGPQSFRYTVL